MRVAIYARFSSDLQDARSIVDQVDAAREHATRQGWSVVAEFSDAAISGSTLHNRPGLLDLMRAAGNGEFDAVLTESLDRLSRDLEDIAGLHKRLAFAGVKIVTLADGEVGKLHVGLKGMIASLYLDDLAQKTRRGQAGRVKAGRIPGGKSYGYDVVLSAGGEDRGQRVINEREAAIIRRVFAEYVAGDSAVKIVARLNAERVPGPRGGAWNQSTINGNPKRGNGLINNRLYTGQIVYNRQCFVKDPLTGKRQAKPNPPDKWQVQTVPELQIVELDVFEAAKARRVAAAGIRKVAHRVRPKHLLSGLIACGCCGSTMIVQQSDRVQCSSYMNKRTCTNSRTIRISEIENRLLEALKAQLMAPELVAIAVEEYRKERERLAKATARTSRDAERDLAAVIRKIDGLVRVIEAGGDADALAEKLNTYVAERRALEAQVTKSKRASKDVVTLHPKAAQRYAAKVANLQHALRRGDEAARDAVALVREVIDRIVIKPIADGGAGSGGTGSGGTGRGRGRPCPAFEMEVEGDVAPLFITTVAVAGPRNHRDLSLGCERPHFVFLPLASNQNCRQLSV